MRMKPYEKSEATRAIVSALVLAAIVLCAGATGWAQRRGGGGHHVSRGRAQVVTSGITFEGVPGLGFDYSHLAAISRGRVAGGTVLAPTQVVNSVVGGIVPVFGVGGYYGFDGYGFNGYEAPQPTVIVVQPQP